MKKIVLAILIMATSSAKSQTIDTTIHDCTCSAVNSVNFSHGFPAITDTINHIGFFNYTDTPKDSICVVNYVVKANSNNQNILFSTYQLSKLEYANWNTDIDLINDIKGYLYRCGLSVIFK